MNTVGIFLVIIAAILMTGALGDIVFRRTQIPDVVWLVLVGMVLGPVSGIVSRTQLATIAPYFGALTLVIVLFEAGIRLDLRELARTAPRSALLAVLTFTATVFGVAVVTMLARAVGWLPSQWSWGHAILTGCILGGSSSIVIMPAMAVGSIEESVTNLVDLEAAFTDALCVIGATAMIRILLAEEKSASSAGMALAGAFGMGTVIGLGAGLAWLTLLRVLRVSEHSYPVTLSALLLLYVVIDKVGGSAALGILAFAVVVGNAALLGSTLKISNALHLGAKVRSFHRELTFIVKSFFFTFMGAMFGPPWSMIGLGFLLGLILFAARVPAVKLALLGSALSPAERNIVNVAMPRGLAAGVLATMPIAAGVPDTIDLPTMVFAAVFASILVFAIGLPIATHGTQAGRAVPQRPEPIDPATPEEQKEPSGQSENRDS